MNKSHWLTSIKARRRRQLIRAVLAGGALALVFVVLLAGGVWAWIEVFGRAPPADVYLWWLSGLGSLLTFLVGSRLPQAPLPGEDPEITAAKEFLEGPRR